MICPKCGERQWSIKDKRHLQLYSKDPLEFARNTIEKMVEIAQQCLEKLKEGK